MKKLIALILIFILLTALVAPASAVGAGEETVDVLLNADFPIYYNGVLQRFCDESGHRVLPISFNGTTYLPVRSVCALVGFGVEWDGENHTAVLTSGSKAKVPVCTDSYNYKSHTISVVIDRALTVTLDGQVQTFCDVDGNIVYPIVYNGTTYLPVRALSNLAHITVEYDAVSKVGILTKVDDTVPGTVFPAVGEVIYSSSISSIPSVPEGAYTLTADQIKKPLYKSYSKLSEKECKSLGVDNGFLMVSDWFSSSALTFQNLDYKTMTLTVIHTAAGTSPGSHANAVWLEGKGLNCVIPHSGAIATYTANVEGCSEISLNAVYNPAATIYVVNVYFQK